MFAETASFPSEVVSTHFIFREFTKGGLVKGGLAMYVFPFCNCNTLGFVVKVQIENIPNC